MARLGQRMGVASLPLHYGKVPPWLFGRMSQLAREVTTVIVDELGAVDKARIGAREKLEAFRRLRAWQ